MQYAGKKQQKDFFISYTRADRAWAEWVSWQLEEAGYTTILQTKDFQAGSNIILQMNEASQEAKCTILILSPDYVKSRYTRPEWAAAFLADPTGEQRKVLPVRVRELELSGLLAGIVYIDLVGLEEANAARELLNGVEKGRVRRKSANGHHPKTHSAKAPSPFPGISSTIRNCPHRRNRFFTGRERFLENLRRVFEKMNLAAQKEPVAIRGLAGIGKTQIALEYAYRHLDRYRFVLWVGATSHGMLSAELATLARLLHLSGEDVKEQELAVAAVKLYLKEQSNWLLILDAVEDLEVVQDLTPLAERGHVLITTQDPRIQEIAQKIDLEKMSLEEGAFFLLRRANIIALDEQFVNNSQEAMLASEISFRLDGLPLALDHAGAYIGQTDCGLEGYLKRYEALRTELMLYVPHSNSLSVAKTFTLSFKKVYEAHHVSAELLQLCAFLHRDAIPEEILIGGAADLGRELKSVVANEIKFDKAIVELLHYSLVRRNTFEKTLTIHGLVQTILKDQMKRRERHLWAVRAVRIVSRAFPEVEHSTWPLCQKYLPHALECAALITEWEMNFIEAGQLLHRVGQYLLERAQYTQAKEFLNKALNIYEENLGTEDAQVAAVLDHLGYLYAQQGGYTAYTDAELFYLRALAIRKKVLGNKDPITALSLNHLGLLYYNQGKFIQAEPLYLEARAIQQQAQAEHAEDLAVTLNNLAWLYYNLGRFDEVKPLLEEALAIQERPAGLESPAMATTLNALAMYYRSTGHDTEAEQFYLRALAIRERVLGHQHPEVATTLNDLAWLYRTLGKFELAADYYQQALAIREQTLGPRHLHVATTKSDMGTLDMDRGKYKEAEELYQQVLTIREQTLGPEHPNVGTILYNLGWLYFHQGKYAQAESSHKRALEIRRRVLGRENLLHTARSLNALAEAYRAQGKYDKAEEDCLQALEIREKELEPTHRNVISSIGNLAHILVDRGKYTRAQELFDRALQLRLQAQGSELPRMTVILSNQAQLHIEQGRLAQAEQLYQQALELYARVLDEQHPDVLDVINSLGMLFVVQEKYAQAESYLERALEERKAILGPDHPHVGQTRNAFGALYHALKRYEGAEQAYRLSLVIREKSLGPEHPYVAQTRHNLGMLYADQEKYTTAQPLLQLSLELRQKILGQDHPHVAQSLHDLARVCALQGNVARAKQLYERALEIDEQTLRADHPHIALVLTNYAALLRQMGREPGAKKLEDRARAIQANLAIPSKRFNV